MCECCDPGSRLDSLASIDPLKDPGSRLGQLARIDPLKKESSSEENSEVEQETPEVRIINYHHQSKHLDLLFHFFPTKKPMAWQINNKENKIRQIFCLKLT